MFLENEIFFLFILISIDINRFFYTYLNTKCFNKFGYLQFRFLSFCTLLSNKILFSFIEIIYHSE